MRSNWVVRASDCQWRSRNSPGNCPQHPPTQWNPGIHGATNQAVLNTMHIKKSIFSWYIRLTMNDLNEDWPKSLQWLERPESQNDLKAGMTRKLEQLEWMEQMESYIKMFAAPLVYLWLSHGNCRLGKINRQHHYLDFVYYYVCSTHTLYARRRAAPMSRCIIKGRVTCLQHSDY